MSRPDEVTHAEHAAARADAIIDLACGQPVEATMMERIRGCVDCVEEVRRHQHTIAVLRSGTDGLGEPDLPPGLWTRIADELDMAASTEREVQPAPHRHPDWTAGSGDRSRTGRRQVLGAAAALVLVAGAGVIGYRVGASNDDGSGAAQAHAALHRQPGSPASASGTAIVRAAQDGRTVDVRTSRLPATSGYYEVWLFDPQAKTMVAIGTLGRGRAGSFTVPAGLDLHKFHVVDISAQKLNGDNTHQRSVLRGSLS